MSIQENEDDVPLRKRNIEIMNGAEVYVSVDYFNTIYRDMQAEFYSHYQSILQQCHDIKDQCREFVDFAEVEFPKVRANAQEAQDSAEHVEEILHI